MTPLAILLVGLKEPGSRDAVAALMPTAHSAEGADLPVLCEAAPLYPMIATSLCFVLKQPTKDGSQLAEQPQMLHSISSANGHVAILTLAQHLWAIETQVIVQQVKTRGATAAHGASNWAPWAFLCLVSCGVATQ